MKRVAAQASTKLRIRLPASPCCGRTLTLNHAGVDGMAGPEPDEETVLTAQLLHVRQCTG